MKIHSLILASLIAASGATAEPIKIGWVGPLSGNSAVLGIDSVKAAEIAIEEANSNAGAGKFELVVEDDQYDTAKSVAAYSRLSALGAKAILMSTYGGIFATAERAVHDDVVVVNPLDCNEDIAKLPQNTFCVATQSESVGQVIAEDIIAKKLLPVVVIYDEKNPFMTLVAKVIEVAAGSENAFMSGLDQGGADFKTVLLRSKQKAAKSIAFLGHDPMGKAMQQARAIGINSQFYTVGTITSPGFQELAGQAAEGALAAFWEARDREQLKDFLAKFQSKVGRPPILELATIPSYDAAKLITRGLTDGSVEGLRKSLLATKDYKGLSGTISMDPDGVVRTIRESLYRFEKGKLIPNN